MLRSVGQLTPLDGVGVADGVVHVERRRHRRRDDFLEAPQSRSEHDRDRQVELMDGVQGTHGPVMTTYRSPMRSKYGSHIPTW